VTLWLAGGSDEEIPTPETGRMSGFERFDDAGDCGIGESQSVCAHP
jgi:hypothetical protein